MIQVKHIKRVTSFLLILVTALLLVACGKKDNVPYGSLKDETYLSFGDVKITQKELYDNLKRESQDLLNQLVVAEIFKGYETKANSLLDEVNPEEDSLADIVQKRFDDAINSTIFNTTDVDVLKDFPEVNIRTNVANFVNNVYRLNYNIDRDQLSADLLSILNKDANHATGYYQLSALRDIYLIDIQKYLYAGDKLEQDLDDEESTQYVKESDLITYYKNNVLKQHDVNVFFFHFLSLNEANAALRHVGIKASSTGRYYEVPNIRLVADYEAVKAQSAVINALDKAGLTAFFAAGFPGGQVETEITESQFNDFYDAYAVSDSSANSMEDYEVLNKFIELYNYVNVFEQGGQEINGLVVGNYDSNTDLHNLVINKDDLTNTVYKTNYTREELNEINSTFANYIYNELSEDKPYSTLRAVGSHRYLAFVLSNDVVELDYISDEKDDDDKDKFVTIDDLKRLLEDEDTRDDVLKQLSAILEVPSLNDVTESQWTEVQTIIDTNKALWKDEVSKNRLTDSYISTTINKVIDEMSLEIFDKIVREYYNKSGEATGKNKSGDLIAKFSYTLFDEKVEATIKVDDFYTVLERNNGLEMALDYLTNQYLLQQWKKKDHGIFNGYASEIDEKKFKDDYKELITNFSNNSFAQAGYPASMGRETFILLLFGATSAKEAIELGYLIPKLREVFFENTDLSFPALTDDEKYATLQEYTEKQYKEHKGLTVHHLLVYFDTDGSGTPTDPKEVLDTLTPQEITEVKEAIVELHALILNIIGSKATGDNSDAKVPIKDYENVINNYIIPAFNESARIDLGNFGEARFQNFKKLGLNLKFENISSTISNTSNFPYGSSTLDSVFYNRAMELHDWITDAANEDALNGGIPHFDFGGGFNVLDDIDVVLMNKLDEDGIMSSFGFHFILVNKIAEKVSAKYKPSQSELDDPRYQITVNDETINAYNEDFEYLTLNQIKYYLLGKDEDALVPTAVQKAIDTYFTPVNTLYNSNYMKQAIFYNFIKGASFSDSQKAKFDVIVEINELAFYNYMPLVEDLIADLEAQVDKDQNLIDYLTTQYINWDNLYGGWFEAFKLK